MKHGILEYLRWRHKEARESFLTEEVGTAEGEFDTSSVGWEKRKLHVLYRQDHISICGFAVDLIKIVEEVVETNI